MTAELKQKIATCAPASIWKPYPAYKDSGVEWLGKVPEHWEVKKIKYLISLKRGSLKTGPFGSQIKNSDLVKSGFKVYNQRSVLDNDFDYGEDYISEEKFLELKNFEIFPQDVLITTRGTIGRCAIFPEGKDRGILHPCLIRIQFNGDLILNEYAQTYIQDSNFFKESILNNSNATTIEVIYGETLRNVIVVLPNHIKEQSSILKYLKDRTLKIDTLIEKKQRLIDLLKEERTATINQAVMKGLNLDVPMKDSGIEWLMEIPKHWDLTRLKFICSIIKDGTHQPPSRQAVGIPLLSVRNIVNGKFVNLDDDSLISMEDYKQLKRSIDVVENDIVLAIVGATLGKVAIVENMKPFAIQRSLAVFRPIQELIHFKFLAYFFQSFTFQRNLWKNAGFSAQPGIYLETLANFHCGLPSIKEQQQINIFLDSETERIDLIISRIKKEIEFLQEYRTALISEVVTGKIDVRGE